MPSRNYDKYVYLTVALEKGSAAHQALLAIAQSIDSKQLPTVASMFLAECLERRVAGTLYGGGAPVQPVAMPAQRTTAGDVVAKETINVDENTDAAVDEW